MTGWRLAVALAYLAGCARSSALGDEQQYQDPIGVSDAGGEPLPTLDATVPAESSVPRDAAVQEASVAPVLDAGGSDDAGILPVVDAGQDSGGPVVTGPGTLSVRSLPFNAATRSYLLYLPAGLDTKQPIPLVSVHHPYGQNGQYMVNITTWRAIADRERIAVAFPEGGSAWPWYVGEGVCNWGTIGAAPAAQDDVGFVRAMVADIQGVQAIGAKQVFVAGLSMGGYFANHVGCQGRDFVRAVAAHSGGTYAGGCPDEPVPVMVIHGDSDSLIPLTCARDAIGYWASRNGCTTTTNPEPVKEGTCLWNTGCPAGREIGLCIMKGMDHGWAGSAITGNWLQSQYGGGVQFEDAAEMIWKFFKKYR